MRTTTPFLVIQNGKPIFTIHAYSLEQARAIIAAKVAGETVIVGPASRDGAARSSRIPGAASPRWPAYQRCRSASGAAWSARQWSSRAS